MNFLRLYIVAIFFGLASALAPVGFDAATAAPVAAKKAKGAKKAPKGKAGKVKGASTKGKKAKAGSKKTAKAKPAAKTKGKVTPPKASALSDKAAPTKVKKVSKVPLPVEPTETPAPSDTAQATATPPTEDQHLSEELQSYEDAESGPWLYLFVAFIVASVGLLVYLRKKRLAGAAGQGRDDLQHSKPETAFGSSLSSLDLDKSKTSQPLSTQPPKSRVG